MNTYFDRLFTFDRWANGEVARALAEVGRPPEGAARLLAHIVGAEGLWLRRLGRDARDLPVWPELSVAECEAEMDPLREGWRRFLAQGDAALSGTIAYTNSKGERWTSPVMDVVTHVVAHGVHHRAQIASRFREAGLTPPYVDFIEASRRGHLDAGTARPV
jgi:uncharacterized damage-inducible protein DinB